MRFLPCFKSTTLICAASSFAFLIAGGFAYAHESKDSHGTIPVFSVRADHVNTSHDNSIVDTRIILTIGAHPLKDSGNMNLGELLRLTSQKVYLPILNQQGVTSTPGVWIISKAAIEKTGFPTIGSALPY